MRQKQCQAALDEGWKIDEFDLRLAQLAYRDESVELLTTIPGVNIVASQALPLMQSEACQLDHRCHPVKSGTGNFVQRISKSQLITGKSKPKARTAKNTGRQLQNTQAEK